MAVVAEPLLVLKGVSRAFGGVQAVKNLDLSLHAGEILGLIGPNGSGKSTTVNLISGSLPVTTGQILFAGQAVQDQGMGARVNLGMARTFQTTSLFPEFTVFEQVLMASHVRRTTWAGGCVLRTQRARSEQAQRAEQAQQLIDWVGLGAVACAQTCALSSAQQRLLMVATALASEPKLILLDEPAAGMVEPERRQLAQLILKIQALGIAVLLIEHHMGLIMGVCQRIVVLNFGQKMAEGTPAQIRTNPQVIDAYLGSRH
jgi:ABC-type branched-subunit amino acid transport system ATPase component